MRGERTEGWFEALADHHVLLNLAFVLVLVAGVLAWVRIPKEEFPQVTVDRVIVAVTWPGAPPSDLEATVLRPVEDALGGVDGVKHTYAEATEGVALVTVEFVRGTDADDKRDEVERAVLSVRDRFPEDVLEPRVSVARLYVPITRVCLLGDVTRLDLADTLAAELAAIPGVREVVRVGEPLPEVRVELDAARSEALGVGTAHVSAAIRAAAVGAPAGDVSLDGREVVVRTPRALERLEDLRAVPLVSRGGTHLTVGDLATVRRVWAEPVLPQWVNGQPALQLVLLREDDADSLRVVRSVEDWLERRRLTLPAGLDLVSVDDSARVVRDRLRILGWNALVGAVLVAAVLGLFIGARNAALVVWGMPVAWLGAIIVMQATGVTISVVSSFGLLLVTGIIVDDAIVVVENVQRHLEMGKSRRRAALDGTREVIPAVTSATVTTCLAFAPLVLLEGAVGRVMAVVPQVVILSLLASLAEAFLVLPGHLAHFGGNPLSGENAPTRALKRLYAPVLQAVTGPWQRYVALGGVVLVLLGVGGLASTLQTVLQTPGNPYYAYVNVDLRPSASRDATRAALERVEATIAANAHLVAWTTAQVGRQVDPNGFPTLGDRYGQIKIGFHNRPETFDAVPAFLEELRTHLDADPALEAYGLEVLTGGPPAGRDIDLRVRGVDGEGLVPVVGALTRHLESRPGVVDVRSEAGTGRDQLVVRTDAERAARFGLREAQVTLAARAAMDGERALDLALDERTTPVVVALDAPVTDATSLGDVLVPTPGSTPGSGVRLRQVADVERVRDLERIHRVDGQRAIRLSALVDRDVTSPEAEQAALEEAFHGVAAGEAMNLFYGGALADSAESFAALPRIFLLAVLGIYAVLAIQFRSYVQPLIILFTVPMGLAGVVLGLFALDMDLSLIAAIGAVGLSGIVVNDAIVLVDFVNRARAEGMSLREAVVEGSLTRLRAILITTVTTVLGLGPLALGVAGEEPLLAPMAVSIAFGLAFATALTLVAVPVLTLVVDDLGRLLSGGRASSP